MEMFPTLKKLLTFETECVIVPLPKQSTTFGKGHAYTDKKKAAYVAKLAEHFRKEYKFKGLMSGPISVQVLFVFPTSKSNLARLGVRGWYPHLTTPDIDNLTKPLFDALTGTVWKDDKQVFHKNVLALNGKQGKIHLGISLCKIPKTCQYRLQ